MNAIHQQMHMGVFVLGTGNHIAGWRYPGAATSNMDLPTIREIAGIAELGKSDARHFSHRTKQNGRDPSVITLPVRQHKSRGKQAPWVSIVASGEAAARWQAGSGAFRYICRLWFDPGGIREGHSNGGTNRQWLEGDSWSHAANQVGGIGSSLALPTV
jgi:hypothetical protein